MLDMTCPTCHGTGRIHPDAIGCEHPHRFFLRSVPGGGSLVYCRQCQSLLVVRGNQLVVITPEEAKQLVA